VGAAPHVLDPHDPHAYQAVLGGLFRLLLPLLQEKDLGGRTGTVDLTQPFRDVDVRSAAVGGFVLDGLSLLVQVKVRVLPPDPDQGPDAVPLLLPVGDLAPLQVVIINEQVIPRPCLDGPILVPGSAAKGRHVLLHSGIVQGDGDNVLLGQSGTRQLPVPEGLPLLFNKPALMFQAL